MTDREFKNLYEKADKAGQLAASNQVPEPMVVLDGNARVFEVVSDGVCGFAWVNMKPGNSKFANWLKKNKLARSDEYYGGVTIWVSDYNQSMERKSAYAGGFASVLIEAGYTKTYAMSRMD